MIAKKFLTLALAVVTGCALAWDGNLQLFHRGEGHEPQAIAGTTTAGVRFAVENAIKGVSACCPSYNNSRGGLTFSLYPWAGSVVASRARGTIATKRFEDFEDNQTLELSFAKQPAGVYYAELSRGTERVGVWKAKQGRQGVESFLDGCPVGGRRERTAPVRAREGRRTDEGAPAARLREGRRSPVGRDRRHGCRLV